MLRKTQDDATMNPSPTFRTDEVAVSQLPAVILLAKMGWKPLRKEQVDAARGGRKSAVILESITREYLRNHEATWGSESTPLSEDSIDRLIYNLKDIPSDTGYGKQAENIWDKLVLPQSVEQSVRGSRRAVNARLINFKEPEKNLYHLAWEFEVESTRSGSTRRPDIVLFINGIPVVVIENKKPAESVQEGVSQTIRNQKLEEIPQLYVYAQVLLSINKNNALYATTGTPRKLWNKWQKQDSETGAIRSVMKARLGGDAYAAIVEDSRLANPAAVQDIESHYLITHQDYALHGLCEHNSLLRMVRYFILFDGSRKMIARYQQVQAVGKTLARIAQVEQGRRKGGVIWHTQGSGKSLTMVMLARALLSSAQFSDSSVVLVTDRVDLDKQIKGTFHNTGMEPRRAGTGKELAELVNAGQAQVITTIINKFETAAREKAKNVSNNIFVLVDEGHRTQYGRYHAQMQRVLPNACYVAYTGTPIARKDRSTTHKFGSLIDTYTMRDAIADGAVVPLVYEGRMALLDMDAKGMDAWFARLTRNLNEQQKADLKKKYARTSMLAKLDSAVKRCAFDISEHFRQNFKGTVLKGQLVAPDKKTALKYKEALDLFGDVTSEVLISSPDTRSGHEEVDEGEADDAVVAFWEKMMKRYGNEENYNDTLIRQFKTAEDPQIIIVVSKLLTGFDAPRNAVLYLARPLTEGSTLLQAVARVNRVLDVDADDADNYVEKEVGLIIDYQGILKNFEKAITEYDIMADYDPKDVEQTFISVAELVQQLQQSRSELLDLFRGVADSEEAYERHLKDKERREEFYAALHRFSKLFTTLVGLAGFYDKVPEHEIEAYKRDVKRFTNLRAAVKLRYAEEVDFRDYEKKIEKVLHDHVSATDIVQVAEPVDIYERSQVEAAAEKLGSDEARADMIANGLKRDFTEKWDQNPALYQELSEMLQKVIDEFVQGRLETGEYLEQVREVREVLTKGVSKKRQVPQELAGDDDAAAYYGYLVGSVLKDHQGFEAAAVDFARAISEIVRKNRVVDMFKRQDITNALRGKLDDYMYDVLDGKHGIDLTTDEMDEIQEKVMAIAEARHRDN